MSVCCVVPNQVSSLDLEEIELLKWGYRKVFYVAFYCQHCGSCRLMTALPPDHVYIDWFRCGRAHCHSGLLATGYTRQQSLPQCEVWAEPVNMSRVSVFLDDLPVVKPTPRRAVLTRGQRLSASTAFFAYTGFNASGPDQTDAAGAAA